MKKFLDWLNGKKRNIALFILLIIGVLSYFGIEIPKLNEADITQHLDKLIEAIGYLGTLILGIWGIIHKWLKVKKAKKNG